MDQKSHIHKSNVKGGSSTLTLEYAVPPQGRVGLGGHQHPRLGIPEDLVLLQQTPALVEDAHAPISPVVDLVPPG